MRRNESSFEIINSIIKKMLPKNSKVEVKPNSRFKEDLGFDSLAMAELIMEVESSLTIDIADKLGNVKSIEELVGLIEGNNDNLTKTKLTYDIDNFPMKKTSGNIKFLGLLMKWAKRIWKLNISGVERINKNENYIICANHESHLDGIWILSAIGRENLDLSRICCLAKQEHLHNKITRMGLKLLGGIPVDRSGNTAPAFKKALECLKNNNYSIIIHPEGTRTRDGEMKSFKDGAAKLSIDSGVKILPVKIDGAYEIYPSKKYLPKLFNWGKLSRYSLTISFGNPILPKDKSIEELTNLTRKAIEEF